MALSATIRAKKKLELAAVDAAIIAAIDGNYSTGRDSVTRVDLDKLYKKQALLEKQLSTTSSKKSLVIKGT